MPQTSKLTLGRALKHGFSLAIAEPWTVLLGFLAEVGESLMTTGFQVAFALAMFSWLARWLSIQVAPFLGEVSPYEGTLAPLGYVVVPLAGGAIAASVIVMFLRGIWAGALVRRFSHRLLAMGKGGAADGGADTNEDGDKASACQAAAGQEGEGSENLEAQTSGNAAQDDAEAKRASPPPVMEGFDAFPKVAAFSLAFLPVVLTVLLLGAMILAVCLMLLNAALSGEANFVPCAAAIAFGLTLLLVITRGACVIFRLGVVKMLSGARDVLDALAGGVRILSRRIGFFALLFLAFSILESMATSSTTVMEGFWRRAGDMFENPGLAVVVLALLMALTLVECAGGALVVSAEYGALTAAVLDDEGLLPDAREEAKAASMAEIPASAAGAVAAEKANGDGAHPGTCAPLQEGLGDEILGTSVSDTETDADGDAIVETSVSDMETDAIVETAVVTAPDASSAATSSADGAASENLEAMPAISDDSADGEAIVETAVVPEAGRVADDARPQKEDSGREAPDADAMEEGRFASPEDFQGTEGDAPPSAVSPSPTGAPQGDALPAPPTDVAG